MFDCVIPTREGRHGRLFIWKRGRKSGDFRKGFYETIHIQRAKWKADMSPINEGGLKEYSKAYLCHLFRTKEPLGMRFATLNNLEFYSQLMIDIRKSIRNGKL